MYLKNIYLSLGLIISSSTYANDSCPDHIYELIGDHLGLENFQLIESDDQPVIISSHCKIWPYRPNITLAAFVYKPTLNNRTEMKNVIIAIINKQTKKITHTFTKTIEEDAVTEFGSLGFDTAKYQLSPHMRAIGVRFHSAARGASCGEAYWNNQLILFIPEKDILRPVLSLYTQQQQSLQGCLGFTSENSIWQDAQLSISLKNNVHNGFADLKITAKIEPNFAENFPNKSQLKAHQESYTLRYDGQQYRLEKNDPWWLKLYNDLWF